MIWIDEYTAASAERVVDKYGVDERRARMYEWCDAVASHSGVPAIVEFAGLIGSGDDVVVVRGHLQRRAGPTLTFGQRVAALRELYEAATELHAGEDPWFDENRQVLVYPGEVN
jgi:hypothetical protein